MTIKKLLVCVSIFAALVLSFSAMAQGITFWMNDSNTMQVAPESAAIHYGPDMVDSQQLLVLSVKLDGFLICHPFSPDSSPPMGIRLRPEHGDWVIGSSDRNLPGKKVQGSVPFVTLGTYTSGLLGLASCGAQGEACSTGGSTRALQCYMADAQGGHVTDIRQIFASSFDDHTDTDNSWVRIHDIQVPQNPSAPNALYRYKVSYHIPAAGGPNSTVAVPSWPSSKYVLQEGYDQAVFESCSITMGGVDLTSYAGQPTQTESRSCKLRPGITLPTAGQPVVMAAISLSPAAAIESTYTDNVTFGDYQATALSPTVTVSKASSPVNGSLVAVGDTITYQLAVHVQGAPLTSSLLLTDTLGGGLTFAGVTNNAGDFNHNVSADPVLKFTLSAGTGIGTHTIAYAATVDQNASAAVASSVVASGGGDLAPNCAACQTSHPLMDPTVRIEKSSNPASGTPVAQNEPIVYTLKVWVENAPLKSDLVLADTLGGDQVISTFGAGGDLLVTNSTGPVLEFTLPKNAGVPAATPYTVSYTTIVGANTTDPVSNAVAVTGNGGDTAPQCDDCSTSHPIAL